VRVKADNSEGSCWTMGLWSHSPCVQICDAAMTTIDSCPGACTRDGNGTRWGEKGEGGRRG